MASREAAIKNNLNDRARKVGQFDELTTQDIDALIAFYDFTCLYPGCGVKPASSVDHVKPLSKGGTNTFDNLQLLCVNHNKAKGDEEIDYRKGRIFTGESEDYSYEMNDEENSYKTGESLINPNSQRQSNLTNENRARGGLRANAGRKPSIYTQLKERLQEQKANDAEKAFDLYVQIMENPLEETQMRMAAADRVLDRVLGKADQHNKQERKITIEIIRDNPERQSIDSFARLALSAGTD
jgi:hypothetical protein